VLPAATFTLGTPISFEVTFSRIVQGFAAEGATLLVVPTNTSSYGPSAATALQELQATRMRSLDVSELPLPGTHAPDPLASLARRLQAWFLAGVVSDAGPGYFP
jgi:hypothetical protein